MTDPSLDSSSSLCSQTADAADYGASSLLFLAKGRKDEMTQGGESGEAQQGVISRAASGVKERQHFDSLSSSEEKKE